MVEEADASPNFIFVGHKYVQNGGREWRGELCTRYHSYVVPRNCDMSDKKASACENSTAFGL